jgi:hypothetical protein
VQLNLGYGSGTVQAVRDLLLNLSYSNLQIGDAAAVQLHAKYSDLQLNTAADVNAVTAYVNIKGQKYGRVVHTSKYDDMQVGEVQSLQASAKYTGYRLGTLRESAILNLGYGSVTVDHVAAGFKSIEINSSYTDVSLRVASGAGFTVVASTRYCGIEQSNLELYHDVSTTSERSIKGFRGSRDAPARITAAMSYGKLKIQ